MIFFLNQHLQTDAFIFQESRICNVGRPGLDTSTSLFVCLFKTERDVMLGKA